MKQWSEQGDTKLHFFAEKVLYNCLRSEQDPSLDDPIFMLYDGSKNTDVFFFFAQPHTQRIADIVFIHGLQGSFFSTWMVQQETSDFHHITCWPATYLPAYLANHDVSPPVRILSVSYHARMRKSSSPHPTLSIQEQAADLRKRLDSAGIGERPVIFVTHSLGGLIVKEMLVDESKWEKGCGVRSRDVYAPLLHQTKAIVFYSTPHRGSPVIKKNISLLHALFGFTPVISELQNDSPLLLDLNDAFLDLSPLPDILSLGEEAPMHVGKYEALVVPPTSANPGVGVEEKG